MKSKIIISSIMTVALLASSAAFAQGYDRGGDRGRNEHSQRGPGPDRGPQGNPHSNKYGDKHGDKHGNKHANRHDGRHDNRHAGRGAGPNHNFYKGGHIPREYRGHQYVVNDWRGHHLTPPPRGYNWVQTGGDYVLIAIATGVIAQIILGN